MLDVDPESFRVELDVELPAELREQVEHARETSDRARRAAGDGSRATRAAVGALLGSGLTVRDAGRLLGVSSQRVSQLAR